MGVSCKAGGSHDFERIQGVATCRKCGKRGLLPHAGPQQRFLRSRANIAVFGGAKGGGKSYALLMETTRHLDNPRFGAVIFRRESPQIYNIGGLWDTSEKVYPNVGGIPVKSRGEWVFPKGSKVKFSHLEYDKDVNAWDGQQVPLIGFDELTAFTEKQFWYMLTINRSTCGVEPYLRATCNPDSESWVAELLAWWIDQDSGLAIPERSGKLRWFVREDGKLIWAGSREELVSRFPGQLPKSLTFVPAKLDDNPTLEESDPGYRASLMAQESVIRERLLGGNWKIRPAAGLKFPRDKWVLMDAHPAPAQFARLVRFWDKAYTEGGKGARSAGVLMGELRRDGANLRLPQFWVLDARAGRWGDAERESQIKATAELDRATWGHVAIGIEEEGGAGKHSVHMTISNLAGHSAYAERPRAKKHLRWDPLASQQQIGNVAIHKGPWDWADYVRELDALAGDEALDKGKLKDLADASAGAFKYLASGGGVVRDELIASADDDPSGPLTDEERKDFDPELLEIIDGSRFDEHENDDW